MRKINLLKFISIFIILYSFSISYAQNSPNESSEQKASRNYFEELPLAERVQIQEDLIWTGDYNGMAKGVFGSMTYRALASFQKKSSATPNGILNQLTRSRLTKEALKNSSALSFKVVKDSKINALIGLPLSIIKKEAANSLGGTRWQSEDERLTINTRHFELNDQDFKTYYEKQLETNSPERKITYKFYRDDLLVIMGETKAGKFYIRMVSDGINAKGFNIAFEKSQTALYDRVVIAMANSFDPLFPSTEDVSKGIPSDQAASSQQKESTPSIGEKENLVQNHSENSQIALQISDNKVLSFSKVSCASPKIKDIPLAKIKSNNHFILYEVSQKLSSASLSIGALDTDKVYLLSQDKGKQIVQIGEMEKRKLLAALPVQAQETIIFSPKGELVGLVDTVKSRIDINGVSPYSFVKYTPSSEIIDFLGDSYTQQKVENGNLSAYELSRKIPLLQIDCK